MVVIQLTCQLCADVGIGELRVIRHDSFAGLQADWQALLQKFPGDTVFLTWDWQQLWWQHNREGELHLLTVQQGDQLLGIAPLLRQGERWGFAGGVEVADFLDIIAAPEHQPAVAEAVLDYLQDRGGQLQLRNLRPDSVGATTFLSEARRRGLATSLEPEDVSPRVDLPPSWDAYVQSLSKKDRHELRRKLRRLDSSGNVHAAWLAQPTAADVNEFLRFMRESAEAKAHFLTADMEEFFRAVVEEFAPRGWLRLYFLSIDNLRVASVILFDYGNEFLLYNSGYDPAYGHLAVGLLLKAFTIEDAIKAGRQVFDFLQGNEPYKYDLGARDVPILQLRVDLGASPNGMVRAGAAEPTDVRHG
jgi:CelD/BcsL family acetyltransferase involved in cellulose biosynthesis